MSTIKQQVEMNVSGHQLADWWWECDSNEQADFVARLEEIKTEDPVAFLMQLQFLRDAMEKLLRADAPSDAKQITITMGPAKPPEVQVVPVFIDGQGGMRA